jgi:hypothetical protein
MILLLFLFTVYPLEVELFRFEGGYTEIWYKIPVRDVLTAQQLINPDTLLKKFSYRFDVYCLEKNDSAYVDGVKGARVTTELYDDYFIDFIPLYLYPGSFRYRLVVTADANTFLYNGQTTISTDTAALWCSDVIFGRKDSSDKFVFHDYVFTPVISRKFCRRDTFFAYMELYGLIPDSLFYGVQYQVYDSRNAVVHEKKSSRRKDNFAQADTFSMPLSNLFDDRYRFVVRISDPASSAAIVCEDTFYVVSVYAAADDRTREADRRFSTYRLAGRDSERGKYLMEHGLPDEIEIIPMTDWGRQLELWHYHGEAKEVLFCDIRDDNNPRLIAILKPGELLTAIEMRHRNPERSTDWQWLNMIAPVTLDGQETLEEKRITIEEEED